MCTKLDNTKLVLKFDVEGLTTKNEELTIRVNMLEQQVESLVAARVGVAAGEGGGAEMGGPQTQKTKARHNPLQVSICIIS